MKSKSINFLSLFAIVVTLGFAPAYAAQINTTGNTIGSPAVFAAGDTYIGNGFLTAPLAYSVWYSTNLVTWSKYTGVFQGSLVLVGNVETVPVTVSASLLTNPKLFIQIRAE